MHEAKTDRTRAQIFRLALDGLPKGLECAGCNRNDGKNGSLYAQRSVTTECASCLRQSGLSRLQHRSEAQPFSDNCTPEWSGTSTGAPFFGRRLGRASRLFGTHQERPLRVRHLQQVRAVAPGAGLVNLISGCSQNRTSDNLRIHKTCRHASSCAPQCRRRPSGTAPPAAPA